MRSNLIFAAIALFAGSIVSCVSAAPFEDESYDLLARDFDSSAELWTRGESDAYESYHRRDLQQAEQESVLRRMLDDISELAERQMSAIEATSLERRTDTCIICLEKIRYPKVLISECEQKSHEMCRDCYDKHFDVKCPVCRGTLNPTTYVERACKAATPPPSPSRSRSGSTSSKKGGKH